jgi:hypothetical protein
MLSHTQGVKRKVLYAVKAQLKCFARLPRHGCHVTDDVPCWQSAACKAIMPRAVLQSTKHMGLEQLWRK